MSFNFPGLWGMAASCFAVVNPEKLTNPAASMDFITGVKCCTMTTSLSVVHDEIIDILAANGSHSKEHGDTVLLTTVDNIISNEVSIILKLLGYFLVPDNLAGLPHLKVETQYCNSQSERKPPLPYFLCEPIEMFCKSRAFIPSYLQPVTIQQQDQQKRRT